MLIQQEAEIGSEAASGRNNQRSQVTWSSQLQFTGSGYHVFLVSQKESNMVTKAV